MPVEPVGDTRCILLLSDSWSAESEGICGVNQSIALTLSRYKGIKVFCTLFQPLNTLSQDDRSLADENNVTLISLASNEDSVSELYALFNENPLDFFSDVHNRVPYVSHIVGHSPVTAEAALKLKEELYPESKVILFYHVIPRDVEWLGDQLPYVVPTDSEQVRLGELADVVYSVTEKVHWYYTAKFRNRCKVAVDHRLFLPQCSEKVFSINRQKQEDGGATNILSITHGREACAEWAGLDISACGINKVTIEMKKYEDSAEKHAAPCLKVAGAQMDENKFQSHVEQFSSDLNLNVSSYDKTDDLYGDLAGSSICIVPSRAEPFGYVGLNALSAGIPTLIAEDSCLASIVKRLTSEPEAFLVPVTQSGGSVRQDGSVWRDRILGVIQNYQSVLDNATQLRMALRRDEMTKETHDDFVSYVLGGVHIKHELTGLRFQFRKDEDKEVPVMASFNRFLSRTMKQCWRYKHHPLTTDSDLYQVIPGVDLPIKDLVSRVTDKIEERDRRIVAVEKTDGSMIVYCPTADALSDLWAMCDVINRALSATLLAGEENAVLDRFKLAAVTTRTIVSGPEFLQYKTQLMKSLGTI